MSPSCKLHQKLGPTVTGIYRKDEMARKAEVKRKVGKHDPSITVKNKERRLAKYLRHLEKAATRKARREGR